jgi:hypothetical protein
VRAGNSAAAGTLPMEERQEPKGMPKTGVTHAKTVIPTTTCRDASNGRDASKSKDVTNSSDAGHSRDACSRRTPDRVEKSAQTPETLVKPAIAVKQAVRNSCTFAPVFHLNRARTDQG